jgi:predicted outer membrane repeat protein
MPLLVEQFGSVIHISGEYQTAAIHIGTKVRMDIMHNSAQLGGGAVVMWDGMITVGAESCVIFAYNCAVATAGGAIGLINGTLIVDREANLTFSYNSAIPGGALYLRNSTAHVNSTGIQLKFYDNTASMGGAMYFVYGTMHINTNNSVKFITNSAQVKGGAIYIEAGIRSSITVGNYSKLLLFNNHQHFKEALSIASFHHYSLPPLDISRIFSSQTTRHLMLVEHYTLSLHHLVYS